jgi:transcriptional regulator with XRE-family HTH domain
LKTEKDDLQALSALITELNGGKRQKVLYLQEMILRWLLDTPPKLNDKSFGERLHLLRIDAGLELDELADQCTIAKSTLQGYESGQYDPSITVLLRLCEVFDVTPEYLLIADVNYPSYPDERYAFLRPRQIKSMLDITRSLIDYF